MSYSKKDIKYIRAFYFTHIAEKVGEEIRCLNCWNWIKKEKPQQMFCSDNCKKEFYDKAR